MYFTKIDFPLSNAKDAEVTTIYILYIRDPMHHILIQFLRYFPRRCIRPFNRLPALETHHEDFADTSDKSHKSHSQAP